VPSCPYLDDYKNNLQLPGQALNEELSWALKHQARRAKEQ